MAQIKWKRSKERFERCYFAYYFCCIMILSCQNVSSGTAVTVEKNPKVLDVNTYDLEFEVDPMFRKTSAAFDDGGVEALLFTHLSIRYFNYYHITEICIGRTFHQAQLSLYFQGIMQ